MEQWMVMGAAILVIGMLYPPLFGVVMGAGFIMGIMFVAYKMMGG